MKEKFTAWAGEHGINVGDGWSVEQICDAIISRGVPWPPDLINEEGWQLWTAVLRRECDVASIQWDEVSGSGDAYAEQHALEVSFRLTDKREFKTRIAKSLLKRNDFGTVCRTLEDSLREWKASDDARREAELARADAEYEAKVPDLMEYVVGFRAWQVTGGRIKPIGAGSDSWQGGKEVRASCVQGHLHRAPAHDCECGFYAWNSWEGIGNPRSDVTHVYGVVQACGRLEVHRRGFRAEFMRPVLLGYDDSVDTAGIADGEPVVMYGPDYRRVKEIADDLGGIEVCGFSTIAERAMQYGQFIPANPMLLPSEADEDLDD